MEVWFTVKEVLPFFERLIDSEPNTCGGLRVEG